MTISDKLNIIKNYLIIKAFMGKANNKVTKSISIAEIKEELDKQGKGKDNRDDSAYDPNELAMGVEVEMEHTTDKGISKKTAQDHLIEAMKWKNPKYYTMLKFMEELMKKGYTDIKLKEIISKYEDEEKEKSNKELPSIDAVIKFLKKNPNPDDDKVHAWSKKNGYDNHAVEALFYKLATQAAQQQKEQ